VIELLEEWVKSHGGQEVSTGQLFAALRTLASSPDAPRSFDFKSAVSFGKYLADNLASLRALFGATYRTGRAGMRLWRFAPPDTAPEEAAEPEHGENTEEDLEPWYLEWAERTKEKYGTAD
jgi:hypothetical protein